MGRAVDIFFTFSKTKNSRWYPRTPFYKTRRLYFKIFYNVYVKTIVNVFNILITIDKYSQYIIIFFFYDKNVYHIDDM